MVGSIGQTLAPCLELFRTICDTFGGSALHCQDDISAAAWTDELGRLRVWAANVGAHQIGQSSLEFRLRDALNVKTQIEYLLKDFLRILHDVSDELSSPGAENAKGIAEPDAVIDESSPSELRQLYEEVVNIIDCLYQLLIIIRKPAQYDMLTESHSVRMAEFESHDQDHVRNKFFDADGIIIRRLGLANSRRREYFRRYERNHAKLGKGIEGTVTGDLMSDTNATDFKGNNTGLGETASISDSSQSSYAHSLTEGGSVMIPPLPKLALEGKPFECPYCFFIIDTQDTLSWTKHIIRDIRPYICTFPACQTPNRLYDSRREWFQHFIRGHHSDNFNCPLCKSDQTSIEDLEHHLARHLEEIALFALPLRDTGAAAEAGEASKLSVTENSMDDQVATDRKSESTSSQPHNEDKKKGSLSLRLSTFNPFSSKKLKDKYHLVRKKGLPQEQAPAVTPYLLRAPLPPPPARIPSSDKTTNVGPIKSRGKPRSSLPQRQERQPRQRRRGDQRVIVVRQSSSSSEDDSPPLTAARNPQPKLRSLSPRSKFEVEKKYIKEKERRQYAEKVPREEEGARKRTAQLAEYEHLEKEKVQERLEYEEKRRIESAERTRRRQQQEEDYKIAQAKRRQELEEISILNARQRAERRAEERERYHLDEERLERGRRANIYRRPRHPIAVREPIENIEDRGERFIREALRQENLRRFERDISPVARRPRRTFDDTDTMRRRESLSERRPRRCD